MPNKLYKKHSQRLKLLCYIIMNIITRIADFTIHKLPTILSFVLKIKLFQSLNFVFFLRRKTFRLSPSYKKRKNSMKKRYLALKNSNNIRVGK